MRNNKPDLAKSIVLIGLISSLFIISSIFLSSYPQHLYLNNQTVIDATVGNFENNTVNVRGNQVQYQVGDAILLEGKDYIKITGNQIQIGNNRYITAIRSVSATLSQNVLFEQKIGEFSNKNAGKIIIDGVSINLIPITKNVINIKSMDSDYAIEFVSGTIYFTQKNVMIKLVQDNDNILVYLIGTEIYDSVVFLKI